MYICCPLIQKMSAKAWLNLYMALILIYRCGHNVQGAVVLTPSEIAQVCAGDNLGFICNITGTFLEWRFPLISSGRRHFYSILASDSSEAQKHLLIDNSTVNITFSRISAEDSPVSSRLLISPVTESHNGTEVTCVDLSSSSVMESSTTIVIINFKIQDFPDINVSRIFERDAIIVTLEWSDSRNSSYSYYISIIPTAQLLVNINEITRVTVNLSYHIPYNLTILIHCNRRNLTFFTQSFYYSYCSNPVHQVEDSIQVLGYTSPAIPGTSVAFGCHPPGHLLTGSNTSICNENGEWDPDPRVAVHCKANCGPPSLPTNCHTIICSSTLEGAVTTFVCQSTFQTGSWLLCRDVNVTVVCNEVGNWEPITSTDIDDECTDKSGSSLSHDGKIAIASTISVAIAASVLFSTFGYLCGLHRQKKKLPSSADNPTPVYEDILPKKEHEQKLELKSNVAYAACNQ